MHQGLDVQRRLVGRLAFAAVVIAGIAWPGLAAPQDSTTPATPAAIDPKVVGILRAACDTLAAAQTMSFTAADTYERAARNGQPLYYAVLDHVTLQRPDRLRVIKVGDGIPNEFYYDGKTMMAYVPSEDLVAVADAPPTIDAMLGAALDTAAIYFPFADVIVSRPCEVFDKNLQSAFYVGRSVAVGRTTTDMVAVAGNGVRAELWIGVADHLPRMVRVTYTNEPARAVPDGILGLAAWHADGCDDLCVREGEACQAHDVRASRCDSAAAAPATGMTFAAVVSPGRTVQSAWRR